MSLISFLNAVGASGDGTLGGDLEFLGSIAEADRYYKITKDLSTPGVKHSIPIPAGKKFVIISITIIPTIPPTLTSYAYVDLKFADNTFDRIYYDNRQTSDTKKRDATYGHAIIGDGVRRIDVDLESIGGVPAQVIILGYYADRTAIASSAIRNFSATELSPDDIRLRWDAPFDNGGSPIIGYRIRRGETLNPDGIVTDFVTIADQYVPPNNVEAGITFDDTNLEDNKTYYYQIFPITTVRLVDVLGAASSVVSAKTEIDHPGPPLNVMAQSISSSSARITWESNDDSGGVELTGYIIERSIHPTSGFSVLAADTGNILTTYLDTELVPDTIYYYRLKAINSDAKNSLTYSNVADVLVNYLSPSNLRNTISSDKKSVLLEWDESIDINSQTVTGYKIERSLNGITYISLSSNTNNPRTNYTDTTVDGNTFYYYRVSVIAAGITSPASDATRADIPFRIPSAPRNFQAISESDDTIKLSWDTPLDSGGLPISGYILQRSKSIGFPDGSNANTFEKTNTPNTPISGETLITNTITVSAAQAATIGSVSIDVNITHTWRGDVEIVLVAPNGQAITLKNVDFTDNADNIIESYGGNLFNSLIGLSSQGTWELKVRDAYGAADQGTLISWKLSIAPALESLVSIPLSSDLVEYSNTGLDATTRYYYRIRAVTDTGDGDFSTVENAVTQQSVFGDGSDGALSIPANTTVSVIGSKQYSSITIEDGGVLAANAALIRCSGDYTENGTGKIIVSQSGCSGGIGGITRGGIGGRDPYAGRRVTIRSDRGQRAAAVTPKVPAVLTPPTTAVSCTDDEVAANLLNDLVLFDQFKSKFTNQIKGGKGSDGSAAAVSGNGGNNGSRATYNGSAPGYLLAGGGNGGNGGTGAQGVDGVLGGGKVALILKTIVNTLRVTAQGKTGNNGNQGTGQAGTAGGARIRLRRTTYSGAGTSGSAASTSGTNGSKGSDGGIVYVVYDTIPDTFEIEDDIDVSGGLGGFNGNPSTSSTPLSNIRAGSGDDGIVVTSDSTTLLTPL